MEKILIFEEELQIELPDIDMHKDTPMFSKAFQNDIYLQVTL
jgi:hypothetical protein